MNLKTLATLAATIVATTTVVAGEANKSCGANSKCAKKEQMSAADAKCSKKMLRARRKRHPVPRKKPVAEKRMLAAARSKAFQVMTHTGMATTIGLGFRSDMLDWEPAAIKADFFEVAPEKLDPAGSRTALPLARHRQAHPAAWRIAQSGGIR